MPTENDVGNPELPRNELQVVHAFTGVMIEKLVKNQHKGGWKKDGWGHLHERLDDEGEELYKDLLELDRLYRLGANPMSHEQYTEHLARIKEQAKKVARECADVANFAMMIADVVGGLEP